MPVLRIDLDGYIDLYKQLATSSYRQASSIVRSFEKGDPQAYKAVILLGSEMAALSKSIKRSLIRDHLGAAARRRLDITPTAANNVAKRVLGRGIDKDFLRHHFATPGRTAASKTTVTAEHLEDIEDVMRQDLSALAEMMADVRRELKRRFPMIPGSLKS